MRRMWEATFSRSSAAVTAIFPSIKSDSNPRLISPCFNFSLSLSLETLLSILTQFYGSRETRVSNIKDILLSERKILHDEPSAEPTHDSYKEHADGAQKEKMRVLRLPGSSNVELKSNNWSYNEFFQFPTPIPIHPSLLLIISHLELTLNLSDTPSTAELFLLDRNWGTTPCHRET